ncbi:MAG: hypothetical protein ACYDHZ_10825 [Dehalococcoidia bacterium]|jgi:hypothetical protein
MMEQKPSQNSTQEQDYRDRKMHHHRFSGVFAGLLLILLGILLFMASQGIVSWDKWWQLFLIGLGVILLIDVFLRYSQDKARGFPMGRIIAAIVLIVIGVVFIISAINWWPLVLVAVGVAILIGGLVRRSSDK